MTVPIKFSDLRGLTDLQLAKHLKDYTHTAAVRDGAKATITVDEADHYLLALYDEIESRVTRSVSERNHQIERKGDAEVYLDQEEYEELKEEAQLLAEALAESCRYLREGYIVPIWVDTDRKGSYELYFKEEAALRLRFLAKQSQLPHTE